MHIFNGHIYTCNRGYNGIMSPLYLFVYMNLSVSLLKSQCRPVVEHNLFNVFVGYIEAILCQENLLLKYAVGGYMLKTITSGLDVITSGCQTQVAIDM